jgi:2-amino-4-hydroxy-6-hydroxymethyldihydropteridine diphosphokinase
VRAFLALGSNLGDRRRHLDGAVTALGERVVRASAVYETEPVGGPDGQGPYLNMVVEVDTDLDPHALLDLCHDLEAAAGRVRAERWGPRTLDVDILWVEGVTVDEPDLQIPHPRMRGRRFVMAPLAEIAPDVAGEGWEKEAEGEVRRVG